MSSLSKEEDTLTIPKTTTHVGIFLGIIQPTNKFELDCYVLACMAIKTSYFGYYFIPKK